MTMNQKEICDIVSKAADGSDVTVKIRSGTQIKANGLWEGSCSPNSPRRKVGLFLVNDGATNIAIEGARRRLTLDLPFPEAVVVISGAGGGKATRQVKVLGYSDSERAGKIASAFEVPPLIVAKPAFTRPPEPVPESRQQRTHNERDLQRLLSSLRQTPNVILQGAPGTGKSSLAFALVRSLASATSSNIEDCRFGRLVASHGGDPQLLLDDSAVGGLPLVWEFVQLHPGYAYDDLVRRIAPTSSTDGQIRLQVQDGLLPHLCRLAERLGPEKPVVLILDEINRCNFASVLGEFLLGIDQSHRGTPVRLQVQSELLQSTIAVPPNLWFVGTMNTADRSLALIDYAVRRRFRFLNIEATRDVVFDWYQPESVLGELAALLFESCNAGLPPRLRTGASIFLVKPEPVTDWPERLARRVSYEVFPLLREYVKEGLRDRSPILFKNASLAIDDQRVGAQRIAEVLREMIARTESTSSVHDGDAIL